MVPDPFRKWMIDGDYPPDQSFALEGHTHAGGGNHNLLSATHTDTLAASPTRGDIMLGNTTPAWARLPIGLSGRVLRSDGTDPAWAVLAHADLGSVGANDHHVAFVQADHDGLPNPHHAETHTHASHTGIGANDHHAQSHTHASHTGIGATDHHSNANDHVRAHVVAETLDHTFPGGSTFLRADGVWASPPGGSEAFPVGSVFIAVVATNPGTLLGYGTWAAIAAGRVLVGLDSGDTDFDTVEETGGAKTVTLTSAEMPSHTHPENAPSSASGGTLKFGIDTNASGSQDAGIATGATGGGGAHANVQPYFVVYMWKRTA